MPCDRCNTEGHESNDCQFADNPDLPIISADWERGGYWRIYRYDENGLTGPINHTKGEMINGVLWGNQAATLLIESAHLAERTGQSLAQVYHGHELQSIHERAVGEGVNIIAFPQKMTEFARYQFGIDADKDRDPEATLRFYCEFGEDIPMKKWAPRSARGKAIDNEANRIRKTITWWLNELRESKYDHDTVNQALEVVSELNSNPPGWFVDSKDDVFEHLKIKLDDNGQICNEKLFGKGEAKGLMTLYVCIFDEGGKVRRKQDILDSEGEVIVQAPETPEFIGIGFIWGRLLLMSPYHGSSGTARANLMYQGLSNFDKGRIPYELIIHRPCRRKKCEAQPGERCKKPDKEVEGVLELGETIEKPHPQRTSRFWPESRELRNARIQNRRIWRGYQKSMLRALRDVGERIENQ